MTPDSRALPTGPWQARVAEVALWLYLMSPVLLEPALGKGSGRVDAIYAFHLGMTLLWAGFLRSLVARPLLLHLCVLPFYLTTATDLFLMGTFGNRLSSGYIGIILTDHGETAEFLVSYWRPVLLTCLLLTLVYGAGLWLVRPLRVRTSWRVSALLAVLIFGAYAAPIGRTILAGGPATKSILSIADKEMSAPMGVLVQTGIAIDAYLAVDALKPVRDRHRFNAVKQAAWPDEVYVYVIGESSRPQNWQLFGYPRPTNPELAKRGDILRLKDLVTTAPHTSYAVPSMLSLQPITTPNAIFGQRSIISAFNEAGFETYWLSTQEVDSWSGITPVIAAEARRRRYFDKAYDGILLDSLRAALADPANGKRLFIVLHTKGSHWDFSRRYPPEFGKFKPIDESRREQLLATYDNSIAYTDWFLSEVIKLVESRGAYGGVFFASDHGENLLDDSRQLFGHALGNQWDMRTAGFVWLTPSARDHVAAMSVDLAQNASSPLSLSSMSHSILDLAGIRADGLDVRQSIFSTKFAASRRWQFVRGVLSPYVEPKVPPE